VVEAPRLHTCPAHLVPKILGKSGDPVTVVFMQLRGPVDCELLLTFEMGEARKIAQTMGKTASISSSDKSMEKSAIEEIGSIMICSFLGAIADYCGIALLPTAPELIRDTFDAIVDGLLAKQALSSEIAMLFDTRFKRTDSTAEGILTMFLSPELQTMLLRKTAAPERQSP
jgi:chemotaxis protein CheY-P-specific phosphatase CheC